MSSYIAFIATLNLCIGYALGVYVGVMPGITRRRHAEDSDDVPIELSVPASPAAEPAPAATSAATTEVVASKPANVSPEPVASESVPTGPVVAERGGAETGQILEGLAAFKSKLEAVSGKLRETTDHREAIDDCAGELKQANTEYLEQTTAAIDSIGSEDTQALTEDQQQLRQSLADQSAEVRRANEEIDEILAEEDTQVAREKLISSSEQLVDSTTAVAEVVKEVAFDQAKAAPSSAVAAAVPEPAAASPPPDNGSAIDGLLAAIEAHLADDTKSVPLQVAALQLSSEGDAAIENMPSLLEAVERLVEQELEAGQSATFGEAGRLLMVLPGDDEAAANDRCERIRQQVAATTFRRGSQSHRPTAYCAVADTTAAKDRQQVIGRLDASLQEASKLGESRTFHHDGKIAAPVKAVDLSLAAMELEI